MTKEELRQNYEKACNAYVEVLNERWEIDGWWAGVGEVYCFLDTECLNMDEIILCVEEDIRIDEYFEWSEYNAFAREYGQNYINLKSWHMGCPRLSEVEIEHLKKLKRDFEDAVKEFVHGASYRH